MMAEAPPVSAPVSLVKVPTENEMWVEIDGTGRRFLRFGRKPCSCTWSARGTIPAGRRVEFGHKPCGKCKGTGRRGNGQCRACKVESYLTRTRPVGTVADYDAPLDAGPCEVCDGTGAQTAGWSDHIPKALLASLAEFIPVRIYAADRELTAGESLLGFSPGGPDAWGGVFGAGSVTDYGRGWAAWHADAGVFAASVSERFFTDSGVQACKLIVRETGELVDHLGILLARGGYTMQGVAPDVAQRAGRRVHTVT
jgi:hypothetical protein